MAFIFFETMDKNCADYISHDTISNKPHFWKYIDVSQERYELCGYMRKGALTPEETLRAQELVKELYG